MFFCAFSVMIVLSPQSACSFAKEGLYLCGEIIIPSIFPITFCVILTMKTLNSLQMNVLDRFSKKVFKLNKNCFLIFVFSLIGGYPLGAKLINSEYTANNLSKENANIMQCFCVNSGAGFAVSAVGYGMFGSKTVGLILFLSQVLSSALLLLILRKKLTPEDTKQMSSDSFNFAESFTLSACEASNTVISICSFVIFFSVLNGYLGKSQILSHLCFITEITCALSKTRNVYLVCALLSFGGLSVLCQIISVSANVKVNIKNFILSRLFCSAVSASFLFLMLKIFKININVFKNNVSYYFNSTRSGIPVAVLMIITAVIFIISLEGKNNGGNLRDDLLQ